VLDEERVDRDPVLPVDRPGEGPLGLLRSPRPHDPESVRDAVDMGVDRDGRDAVPEHEDAVRCLRTDAAQGRELRERPGHLPAEPVEDLTGDLADHPSLGVVEPRPADEGLDRRRGGTGERGRVGVLGEQEGARDGRRFVPGALGEDGAHQDLERVLGVVAKVGGAPVPGPVERREAVEQGFPVERALGHDDARRRLDVGEDGSPGERTPAGRWTPGSERSGSSPTPDGRRSSPTR
jgi:hypothetical protein